MATETTVQPTAAAHVDIDQIARFYDIREQAAVFDFVRDHPEVVAPLLEAVEVVPRFFGPARRMVLDVERDREGHGRPLLFAMIRIDLDVDSSLAALDRFDHEWGLAALQRAERNLIFSLQSV